jgi:cytoskeletal protein RodZ
VTLGAHLKKRRLELGRSLEQLAASTKIHIRILSAIEEDRYSELPARAFTRGFIVNYTKALKLNPNEILDTYQAFLESKFAERPDRDHGHQGYAFEGRELEQNRRWMMVGGSLAAVFAIAILLIFKPDNHRRKEKHKEFEGETATKTTPSSTPPAPVNPAIYFPPEELASQNSLDRKSAPGFALNPTPTSSPTPSSVSMSPSESPPPAPVATSPTVTPALDPLNKGDGLTPEETKFKITLTAKEDAWIRYRSDDLQLGILILRKGRSLVIRARQKLRFETRHPEHFQVKSRNGALSDLRLSKAEIAPDSSLLEYQGQDLGPKELPEAIPTPRGP